MPFPYLYDPTGILPANNISNELHHVAPPVDLDRANFIVPRAAPYFSNGLVIRTGAGVLDPVLIEGADYIFTHHFVEASEHLSTPVYGSVMFLNRNYVGDVYLSYNTLGGSFTLDDYGVVESLTRSLYNIRTVTWDQLLGVPVAFPVLPHPHDVADLTGMAEVVVAIQNLVAAIQGQSGNIGSLMSTLVNHIGGMSPHTPAQVGLEYVQNYGMAGVPELTTRPADRYTSPAWVWAAIELFNLGEAGVSQATEAIVGLTRYATDIEVIDQDNPLDTVAVTVAGMWLAIATNTERLSGATIVTGVDFNAPPYREDGYWAFTNAINTSITPSSGYMFTKKAGNKAYQTETLDNGEISNRMYTGTTWTPWTRAYVATYYGSIPVNILAGSVDLNDYPLAGFYTFDTSNVIGHAPPSYGVSSEHEMVVYQSIVVNRRCQVTLNLIADKASIRTFTVGSIAYASAWSNIKRITGVLPGDSLTEITAAGVWLVLSSDFEVIRVIADPATATIINVLEYGTGAPTVKVLIDDGVNTQGWVTPGAIQATNNYGHGYNTSSLSVEWLGDKTLNAAMAHLASLDPLLQGQSGLGYNLVPAVRFLSIAGTINPALTLTNEKICTIIKDYICDQGRTTYMGYINTRGFAVYRISTPMGDFFSHSATDLSNVYPVSLVTSNPIYQTEASIDTPSLYTFVYFDQLSVFTGTYEAGYYINKEAVVYSYPIVDGVAQFKYYLATGTSSLNTVLIRTRPNATGVWSNWGLVP